MSRRAGVVCAVGACLLLQSCLRLHSTIAQPADQQGCPEVTYLLASNERVLVFFFVGGTTTRRTIYYDLYALPQAACRLRDASLVNEDWLDDAELPLGTSDPEIAAAAVVRKEALQPDSVTVLRIASAMQEFIFSGELSSSTLSRKSVTLVVYTARENVKSAQ